MSLVDRVFNRLDTALARFYGVELPQQNRTIVYRTGQNNPENKAIPLFGSDSGFGEDWATYKRPRTQFVASLPIEHENTNGHVPENAEPYIAPMEVYEDPAISPRKLNYALQTDQSPIIHGGSPVTKWDGVVRNLPDKHGFESSRPKDITIADTIAKELQNEPYWFGG